MLVRFSVETDLTILSKMTSLKKLTLVEGPLGELLTWQKQMPSLTSLSVVDCNMNVLPGWVRSLPSLAHLYVHEGYVQMPDLAGMTQLRSLTFLSNETVYVAGLTNLTALHALLYYDGFEHVAAMTGLKKLKGTEIHGEILPRSWSKLTALTDLDMTEMIDVEDMSTVSLITSLERLTLGRVAPPFQKLVNLKELRAERLTETDGLSHLTSLELLATSLPDLPDGISACQNLKILQLASMEAGGLPPSLCQLSSLRELTIRGGDIQGLPAEFGALPRLEKLTLRLVSHMVALPASVCAVTSLTELNLQSLRSCAKLPDNLGSLHALKRLSMSHLAVSELPASLGELKSLTYLSISYCARLTRLPESITQLGQLRELTLQDCSVSQLPADLGNLTSLVFLHICVPITEVPDSVASLPLLYLAVFSPNLVVDPIKFMDMKNLASLQLRRSA